MRFVPLQSVEARALGLPESRDLSRVVLADRGRQWRGWRALKRLLFHLPVFYLLAACLFTAAFAGPEPRLAYWGFAFFAALVLSPAANFAGDALYRFVARRRRCAVNSGWGDVSPADTARTPRNH